MHAILSSSMERRGIWLSFTQQRLAFTMIVTLSIMICVSAPAQEHLTGTSKKAGGPLKPGFGLSGAVLAG